MDIGYRIKQMREQKGLTQKDLADYLNVTSQAVSRWENNNVEPSLDTLKKMSILFSCNVDDFLSEKINEPAEVVQQVVETELPKPFEASDDLVGRCASCGVELRKTDKYVIQKPSSGSYGRGHRRSKRNIVIKKSYYCPACWKKKNLVAGKNARKKSYILGAIMAVSILLLAVLFSQTDHQIVVDLLGGKLYFWLTSVALALGAFTLTSCLTLKNNFIGMMWFTMVSWGFISLPGIIFGLDVDGIVFAIIIKILFAVIAALVLCLAMVLSTIFVMLISLFAYPFALRRNMKNPYYDVFEH